MSRSLFSSAMKKQTVVAIGNHPGVIQSMLDFDYLSGNEPSLKAIIGTGRKYERYFYGHAEILLPVYASAADVPEPLRETLSALVVLISGRRVFSATKDCLALCPSVKLLAIFAEEVPEQHALALRSVCEKRHILAIGPASVGLLVPGIVKLGAIGGVDQQQLTRNNLTQRGSVAVMSSSGGMTNELITVVAKAGLGVSFAVSFGGERFPLLHPVEAMLAAQEDSATEAIAYFGELGGSDEYEIAEAIKQGHITKPVYAYIAGAVADLFETPPQFGHAKALAQSQSESAAAKADALGKAGARVSKTFSEFIESVSAFQPVKYTPGPLANTSDQPGSLSRYTALFVSSIAGMSPTGDLMLAGKTLPEISRMPYGDVVGSLLLGHQLRSKKTGELIELVIKLLVDHGPYVSGAVNTMIAASAQRDLVSSLSAGLLTIGPRFGGAVNQAAATLLYGIKNELEPAILVEEWAKQKKLIAGIGHKKYSITHPDPRVKILAEHVGTNHREFFDYALAIEQITTMKRTSLILNVDGAIAAAMLDTLKNKEGYSMKQLEELVDLEFFNALFVIARTVGFTAHYLDQRRLDQGLFRLTENDVSFVSVAHERSQL